MKNPILKNINTLRLYAMIWMGIGISHAGILHVYYQLSLFSSCIDSIVYNFLYAAIALNFWHSVRYLNIEKQKPLTLVLAHTISAKIFLALWLISGNFITNLLITDDPAYTNFVLSSFLGRSISGLLYYFIIVLIYYLFIYYFSFLEKLTREADLRTLVKETELSLLRSQLNPHFIFNSLNSISSLTMTDPSKAQDMLVKLSSYLRYALEHNRNKLIALSAELENSLLYLEIEKVRFGNKLIFEKEVQQESMDVLIPNMILQPLLENAIKHGVYESLEPVVIHLIAKKENDLLSITISNNFDNKKIQGARKGIGLRNVQERLQLIYGKKELMKTTVSDTLFEVEIIIPQNESVR
jgi:two-component system LytT family sensor kinase